MNLKFDGLTLIFLFCALGVAVIQPIAGILLLILVLAIAWSVGNEDQAEEVKQPDLLRRPPEKQSGDDPALQSKQLADKPTAEDKEPQSLHLGCPPWSERKKYFRASKQEKADRKDVNQAAFDEMMKKKFGADWKK